jgi:hypothetical protein
MKFHVVLMWGVWIWMQVPADLLGEAKQAAKEAMEEDMDAD